MIIPIRTDYRMRHTPWVNYMLVFANVALYLMGYHGDNPRVDGWLLHPDTPRLAQFFSSVFLHASLMHLLGNMIFLWVFGNAINDRFGHVGYLAFYLAGGVLAGLGYVLLSGRAPVLGASGAISAVTGAYLVLLPRTRVTVIALLLYILMPFEISSLYFLMFQVVWNLVMSYTSITGPAAGGVAYVAHSSGYAFGILVAAGLLAARVLPRDPFDLLNLIRARHRRGKFQRMAAQGYDAFGYNPQGAQQYERRWVGSKPVAAAEAPAASPRELELRRDISRALGQGDFRGAAARYAELMHVAEDAVLSRQQQLDVANQLMADESFTDAAGAYERFLRFYRSYEYIADIYLMLGLVYGRYLQQDEPAEKYLRLAIENLRDPRKIDLAKADLEAAQSRRGG